MAICMAVFPGFTLCKMPCVTSAITQLFSFKTWSIGGPRQSNPPSSHIDIRIEALMPKVGFILCSSVACDNNSKYSRVFEVLFI